MCWGLQLDIPSNGKAPGIEEARAFNGRIATANRNIPVLVGQDGNREWNTTIFGVGVNSHGQMKRFWNARKEALHTAHCWTGLLGQHAVIPVTAYVEHSPNETWHVGTRAWMPALIKHGHGAGVTVITDENQAPIMTDQEHAIEWLNTARWNVLETLNKMPRELFNEADLFMSARLQADARSRVPIARNVHAA